MKHSTVSCFMEKRLNNQFKSTVFMVKKVIIISFTFFGLSLWTLFNAQQAEKQGLDAVLNGSTAQSVVVLELFTSQGCSSCPPADVLLEKVKKAYPNTVFALSYHVDYWDYIGWKDPFGSGEYTNKQRQYAKKFNQRSIYTPELVINGREHFVGSNQDLLYAKINEYKSKVGDASVNLENVTLKGSNVSFGYTVSGSLNGKRLRAILVLDEKVTQVKRGENRNRTLRNSNVVVQEKYVGSLDEIGVGTIEIPENISKDDALTLMLVLENETKDIIGAAKTGIVR